VGQGEDAIPLRCKGWIIGRVWSAALASGVASRDCKARVAASSPQAAAIENQGAEVARLCDWSQLPSRYPYSAPLLVTTITGGIVILPVYVTSLDVRSRMVLLGRQSPQILDSEIHGA
jgi:hypothetical protein